MRLTLREAATSLGCTEKTVLRWISHAGLPTVRLGSTRYDVAIEKIESTRYRPPAAVKQASGPGRAERPRGPTHPGGGPQPRRQGAPQPGARTFHAVGQRGDAESDSCCLQLLRVNLVGRNQLRDERAELFQLRGLQAGTVKSMFSWSGQRRARSTPEVSRLIAGGPSTSPRNSSHRAIP